MTWEEFLATKFGLWIDTRLSTETLHGSGRAVQNSRILFPIEKALEANKVIPHAMCLALKMQWPI